MKYLLINPPLTDPTMASNAISYLIGAAIDNGYTNFSCIDCNIEALNYVSSEKQAISTLKYAKNILIELEKKEYLTKHEQITYLYAIKSIGLTYTDIEESLAIFSDKNKFYDYHLYRKSVLIILRWMDVLSLLGFPGQFSGFSISRQLYGNLDSIEDLKNIDFINRLTAPFYSYLNNIFLERIKNDNYNLIGITVNYASQLPFVLRISKLIKEYSSNTFLCIGGTEVSDIYKYISHSKKILCEIFTDIDAIVIGERESAFIDILDYVSLGKNINHKGIILNSLVKKNVVSSYYENLVNLTEPKYDLWDYSNYWLPEPVIPYSPTRGCYWNKCTFCDYGLNQDFPTSPSRTRPIKSAITDIKSIKKISDNIYFAVDAISPSYLNKLSIEIIEEDSLSIYWGGEIRLEKKLINNNIIQNMRLSGCTLVSFGLESGNQRILNLIDKGIYLEDTEKILKFFYKSNIISQLMGFVGFPGETEKESLDTFDFLKKTASFWSIAGIGDFILTSGSIIAKNPNKFGIKNMYHLKGTNIQRFILWSSSNVNLKKNQNITKKLNEIKRYQFDRPFLGGIDSTHTFLYSKKYGHKINNLFKIDEKYYNDFNFSVYKSPFDTIDSFFNLNDLENYHKKIRKLEKRVMNFNEIKDYLDSSKLCKLSKKISYIEIMRSGEFIINEDDMDGDSLSKEYIKAKKHLLSLYGHI